jgi:LPS-assembly protein
VTLRISVVPQTSFGARARALSGVALAALILAVPGAAAQTADPGAVGATDTSLLGLVQQPGENARMLVEADSLVYDIDDETIAAVGKVVIYYGPYTLLSDRVDVDRRTKRVVATGAVELTDAEGNVVRGDKVDLTDDLRDGVAEGLEVITAQRVAFTARRAVRSNGDVTEFSDGVYLPCVDCNGQRGRKPIWQIRANRIVHRQGEKTITFHDAAFEFLGVPLAWVPVLSQPDPSVRRKSGILTPVPSYSEDLGFGLSVPYFWALAPNMDVTIAPAIYSNQGPLLDVEFRHRLMDGAYSIRAAGLHQNDPNAFGDTSGNRDWRGSVATRGDFRINERWTWGWDLAVATDRSFFDDYDLPQASSDAVTNDVFLQGVDGRNRFEAHGYGFFIQQEDDPDAGALPQDVDLQSKQPIVHPVIDHQVYAPDGVAGGEFSVSTNLTSLTRQRTDIFEYPDGRERLRGPSGTYSRGSIDAIWRRRFVDSLGQVYTPFAYFRGDVFFGAPKDGSGFASDTDNVQGRAMPAVGLEYSYPFLFSSAIGNQIVEPVAQLIVRPNETETGDIANEDAQSLVFDASALFDWDKFSGYDRVEGGTRANIGLRYSGQFVNGMSLTGIAGRSLHLAGANSFATDTPYDTGEESGLESDTSDYVAALSLDTNRGLLASVATRIDDADFTANRLEAQLIGISGPLTAALTYAFIREQPDLGIDEDRSEIQAAGSLRLDENWRAFGSVRFDLENEDVVRHAFGIAYDAEEFSMSVSYAEDRADVDQAADRTVYLRLGFRTLGDAATAVDVDR